MDRLDKVVSVRFTAAEAERIRTTATADGLTPSEYIRRVAILNTIPVVEVSTARCEHMSLGGSLVAASCSDCGPLALITVAPPPVMITAHTFTPQCAGHHLMTDPCQDA